MSTSENTFNTIDSAFRGDYGDMFGTSISFIVGDDYEIDGITYTNIKLDQDPAVTQKELVSINPALVFFMKASCNPVQGVFFNIKPPDGSFDGIQTTKYNTDATKGIGFLIKSSNQDIDPNDISKDYKTYPENGYDTIFFDPLEIYNYTSPDDSIKEEIKNRFIILYNLINKNKNAEVWLIINGKNQVNNNDIYTKLSEDVCKDNYTLKVSRCKYSTYGPTELCFDDKAKGWISCKIGDINLVNEDPTSWSDKDENYIRCRTSDSYICRKGEICYKITSKEENNSDTCKDVPLLTDSSRYYRIVPDIHKICIVGGAVIFLVIIIILVRKVTKAHHSHSLNSVNTNHSLNSVNTNHSLNSVNTNHSLYGR